jgi:hypothetical protein
MVPGLILHHSCCNVCGDKSFHTCACPHVWLSTYACPHELVRMCACPHVLVLIRPFLHKFRCVSSCDASALAHVT